MTESHFRSIVKGISWRIVGTLDTILLSFILTGALHTAFKIGFSEVITKVVLFYFHERIWLKWLGAREQTKRISFIKAFTWRIVGSIDTTLLGWLFSGNPYTGLKIGLTEVATKIILYYFHERLWHRVPVGSVRKWFGVKNLSD